MTRQKKIREGIEKTLRGVGNYAGWEEDATKAVLNYLHSQGVVIKVDRELPENPHFSRGSTTDYSLGLMNGFDQAVESLAGYVAIEPII